MSLLQPIILERVSYTIEQAAEASGISEAVLEREIRAHRLDASHPTKAGRVRVILKDDLIDYLRRGKEPRNT